jgi:glucose-6-phosphate 1-dehydrogenase
MRGAQTFFISCVWLKTVRWQGLNLYLVKQKKIPRRVLILYLALIRQASENFFLWGKDYVIE